MAVMAAMTAARSRGRIVDERVRTELLDMTAPVQALLRARAMPKRISRATRPWPWAARWTVSATRTGAEPPDGGRPGGHPLAVGPSDGGGGVGQGHLGVTGGHGPVLGPEAVGHRSGPGR